VNQPQLKASPHGVGPRSRAELAEDGGKVKFDGVLGDAEPFCDLAIPQSVGDERKHFVLARRQRFDQNRPLSREISHDATDVRPQ
jgi:hypothetical protein